MRTVISGVPSKQIRTYGLVLFLCSAAMYGFTTYGGVRSSDSEVVYRVAESLALRGDFSLQSELEDWKAFGVAYGRGGKLYAIFGPLESILLAPLVKVGDLVNETGWYERFVPLLPLSQFTKGGFFDLLMHRTTTAPRPKEVHPSIVNGIGSPVAPPPVPITRTRESGLR